MNWNLGAQFQSFCPQMAAIFHSQLWVWGKKKKLNCRIGKSWWNQYVYLENFCWVAFACLSRFLLERILSRYLSLTEVDWFQYLFQCYSFFFVNFHEVVVSTLYLALIFVNWLYLISSSIHSQEVGFLQRVLSRTLHEVDVQAIFRLGSSIACIQYLKASVKWLVLSV